MNDIKLNLYIIVCKVSGDTHKIRLFLVYASSEKHAKEGLINSGRLHDESYDIVSVKEYCGLGFAAAFNFEEIQHNLDSIVLTDYVLDISDLLKDAPSDNNYYARRNGKWVKLNMPIFIDIN